MGSRGLQQAVFLYRYPAFRVGEVALVAAVLYHAINGVRICIIDFWPETMAFHRKLSLRGGNHLYHSFSFPRPSTC